MYCTQCGETNPAGANFCANCGHALSRPDPQTTGALNVDEPGGDSGPLSTSVPAEPGIADLAPGTALLVVVRGPNQGARFLLDRDVTTVGRHPDADIFLDDITVSRRHSEFRRESTRFWIHDVGSLNGTYVNGTRADDQLLGSGDEVQVGKFKLVSFIAEQDGTGG